MGKWGTTGKTVSFQKLLQLLLIYSLLSGLLPWPGVWAAATTQKLQPLLRQLAIEEPALMVDLIIQQSEQTDSTARKVVELGGSVRHTLAMINALAVSVMR